MSNTGTNGGKTAEPIDSAGKRKPDETAAGQAEAMEDVQKEAAEEREEDGGYQ